MARTKEKTASKVSGEKRKRSTLPDEEIEVDITAPEPPSKKALRKAKKQKTTPVAAVPAAEQSGAHLDPAQDSDDEAAPRAAPATHSVWIGNLPFTATKATLRDFLCASGAPTMTPAAITRIHIPAPANARATQATLKPQNKGFAYVDFANEKAFAAARALSETPFGGRRVLIKDARDFAGRPLAAAAATAPAADAAKAKAEAKAPTRRVFVGNLGFDVTIEDLRAFYAPCGRVADVHVATFEDSGKCKGFAWVTFAEQSAAEAAVRGFTKVEEDRSGGEDDESGSDEHEQQTKAERRSKKKGMRKWFVNRLRGRPVRCEFAEDPSVRYKRRFGKEVKEGAETGAPPDGAAGAPPIEEVRPVAKNSWGIAPGAGADTSRRRGRSARESTEQDKARAEKAKKVQEQTRFRTGAVTESTGSKVVFD